MSKNVAYFSALAAMACMVGVHAVGEHIATGRRFPDKVADDEPSPHQKRRVKYRASSGKSNGRKDKTHRLKGLRP